MRTGAGSRAWPRTCFHSVRNLPPSASAAESGARAKKITLRALGLAGVEALVPVST
jgi:hypothetical protein